MAKAYVFRRNGNLVVEYRTKQPPNSLLAPIDPLTGKPEDPAWLQIEIINDPNTGEPIPTATVNQAEKTRLQAERLADDQAKQQAEQARKDLLAQLETAIQNYDLSKIDDINDIRKAIKGIILYLRGKPWNA